MVIIFFLDKPFINQIFESCCRNISIDTVVDRSIFERNQITLFTVLPSYVKGKGGVHILRHHNFAIF